MPTITASEARKPLFPLLGQVNEDHSAVTITGRGQPERLKHRASEVWSRRINQEHRLVYRVVGDDRVILQARFHYDD